MDAREAALGPAANLHAMLPVPMQPVPMQPVLMQPVVTRTQTAGCTSGQEFNPVAFFKDASTGLDYMVMACNVTNGGLRSTVMDAAKFDMLKKAVYVHTNGYPYCTVGSGAQTVHGRIMRIPDDEPRLSVDHINRIKTDNRVANLRCVGPDVQNQNRDDRDDRADPPAELAAIGIARMPRRVRWSNSDGEKKFVVDMPPPTSSISGTKSVNVSVVNKFRDILLKMKDHEFFQNRAEGEEDDRRLRATLCSQHDALVKAAHELDPTRFPDGPYSADMEGTGISYIDWCLAKLPPPTAGDVLHGALDREQTVEMLPEIDACAIVRGGEKFKILLDADLFDRASSWGKLDTSGGVPRVAAAQARSAGVGGGKNKRNFRDVVWEQYHGEPPAAGHTVVALNHQQFDLRSANLELRLGSGKSFKAPSPASVRIPDGCPPASVGGRAYLPLGVTFTGGNTLMFKVVGPGGTSKVRKVTANAATVGETLAAKVLPILRQDEVYDERDELYQRLSTEFWQVAPLRDADE